MGKWLICGNCEVGAFRDDGNLESIARNSAYYFHGRGKTHPERIDNIKVVHHYNKSKEFTIKNRHRKWLNYF